MADDVFYDKKKIASNISQAVTALNMQLKVAQEAGLTTNVVAESAFSTDGKRKGQIVITIEVWEKILYT